MSRSGSPGTARRSSCALRRTRRSSRPCAPNPMVALTIDTEVHPPKILLIRGRAELDFVAGIPGRVSPGDQQLRDDARATGRVGGGGAFALPRWHGPDRRDPDLGEADRLETTLPSAVEELVRQQESVNAPEHRATAPFLAKPADSAVPKAVERPVVAPAGIAHSVPTAPRGGSAATALRGALRHGNGRRRDAPRLPPVCAHARAMWDEAPSREPLPARAARRRQHRTTRPCRARAYARGKASRGADVERSPGCAGCLVAAASCRAGLEHAWLRRVRFKVL